MNIRNNKGFNVILALTAVSLTSITILLTVGYIAHQKQQIKTIFFQNWNGDFIQRVDDFLATPTTCTSILPNVSTPINTVTTIPLDNSKMNSLFSDRYLRIKSAQITGVTNIVASAPSLPNTYSGTLELNAEFKNPVLENDKSLGPISRRFLFNVRMYGDNNSLSIKNLKCSSQESEYSLYVSQICNLYGGLLTDGVHCDFPKINTDLYIGNNTANKNMNYVSLKNNNTVTRITMPQMVCYIDTLIAIAAPLPITTVTGSSSVRNYTKFCARPGGDSIYRASSDIKSIFENIK